MFKLSLMPREGKFFLLFQQGSQNIVNMARELKDLTSVWQNVKGRVTIISDMEQDGDAITRDVMKLLYKTFITPFDREDICLIAHSMDEIDDKIRTTAEAMFLYRIEHPTDKARELSEIVFQVAVEMDNAVTEISASHINQDSLLKRTVEINRLENVADRIYRSALAELFTDPKDIAYVIKWREIYEDIESVIDSIKAMSNVLEDISIKYA